MENGRRWDNSWETDWQSAVTVNDTGWFAELQIPLSSIPASDGDTMGWGLQLTRMIERTEKPSFWSPFNPNKGFIGSFGQLAGVGGGAHRLRVLVAFSRPRVLSRNSGP